MNSEFNLTSSNDRYVNFGSATLNQKTFIRKVNLNLRK